MKIALLVPTTPERFDRLKDMLRSLKTATADPDRVEVYVACESSPEGHRTQYIDLVDDYGVKLVWGEHGSSVAGWNAAVVAALRDSDIGVFHMTADDLEFQRDWDKHVRMIFESVEEPLVLHYRDDYRDEARACNPFVNREYVKDFGFLPDELKHFYSDEWLEAMGRLGGCLAYSPSVHIRHLHPKDGRAEWDETYLNPRKPRRMNADAAAWETLQEKLRHESARLRRMVKPELRLVSSCETPSSQQPQPSPSSPPPRASA